MDALRLFADAWEVIAGRLPSPYFEEGEGVATRFANVPSLFLNVSVVLEPVTAPDALLRSLGVATRRASASPFPSGVVFALDGLPADWESILAESGLAPMIPLAAMEAGELHPPRRPAPDLEIRRIDNETAARHLAELNARAYGMPPGELDSIANLHLWHPDTHGYVGYSGGQPVSCAAAFPVAGSAYVALVATDPDSQRKGYAEAVMRHAVTRAQQDLGTMRTTLHASDAGLPVYRAMGYVEGTKLMLAGRPVTEADSAPDCS